MSKVENKSLRYEESSLPLVGRDVPFSQIEGEFCLVRGFGDMSSIVSGKVVALSSTMPYGFLEVECKTLHEPAMLLLAHKDDYMNVLELWKNKPLGNDEEMLIIWSDKHYKNMFSKALKGAMPKLWVMVLQKGAYEFKSSGRTPQNLQESKLVSSIRQIKPDVME